MLSSPAPVPAFWRPAFATLLERLREPRRFIQVVAGPRQVGKTTLVRQVVAELPIPALVASADDPGIRGRDWLDAQWEAARTMTRTASSRSAVLVIDEVQTIPGWSDAVNRLWDEDEASALDLRVVLLASAPLLVQKGLAESLAGRFEMIRLSHWGYPEMREAFGWDLDRFVIFGGYPGAAPLVGDVQRWRAYILDSLVETTLSRDILLLNRVDKPALLRQLFRLGCDYSGQVVSYQKLVGQLQDAGNTTTLAHYLQLLRGAGMLSGLDKFSGSRVRQRGSSPKLLTLNTALATAMSGETPEAIRADREAWGRLVEAAVGAHLVNTAGPGIDVTWWRDRNREVDYVISNGRRTLAIEVASGRRKDAVPGLGAFTAAVPGARPLLVGAQGLSLEQVLSLSAPELLAD